MSNLKSKWLSKSFLLISVFVVLFSSCKKDDEVNAGEVPADNPIPKKLGEASPIKHVIYVIKENRTYDQVFGDMRQGNSDPAFLMYGRDITPNHHALAEKYVLLDNFYATGAISFDGHQWLMQSFVSDYTERAFSASPRGYAWNMSDALTVSPAGFFWQGLLILLPTALLASVGIWALRRDYVQTRQDVREQAQVFGDAAAKSLLLHDRGAVSMR